MNIKNAINQFYFDMTIHELRLMNEENHFGNITYNSLLYLDIIAYKEKCTVSFLADAMNVAKSAVTLKIKELIALGLLTKTQSEEDKRVFYLAVKQEVIDEYKIYDQRLHNAVLEIEGKYSDEQIQTLCQMLEIFSKSFGKEN